MADAQISSPAVEAGESVYTIAPAVEFTLKTISAEFADNGAASAWLPAVLIASDAGLVIARAVDQAVEVAAGGDASVSFFPGVKHAASGASALSLPWCIGTGTLGTDNFTPVDFGVFGFHATDSTLYTWDNAAKRTHINAEGSYLVFALGDFTRSTALAPPVTDKVHLAVNFLGPFGSSSRAAILYLADSPGFQKSSGTENEWQVSSAYILNLAAADVPATIALTARNWPSATPIPAATGEGHLFIVQIMTPASSIIF